MARDRHPRFDRDRDPFSDPAGAAPAGVEASGRMPDPFVADEPRKGGGAMMAVALIGVAVAGAAGWFVLSGGSHSSSVGSVGGAPVIPADSNPYKMRPTDPGGMNVPNQDKTVYERLNPGDGEGERADVEKLLPEPALPQAPPAPPPPELVVPSQPETPPAPPALAGENAQGNNGPLSLKAPDSLPPAPARNTPAPPASGTPAAASQPANALSPGIHAPGSQVTNVEAPKVNSVPSPAAAAPPAKTPPVAVPAVPAAVPAPAAPVARAPAAAVAAVSGGGNFMVQLASVKDEAAAQKTWQQLQGKYPAQLGGLSLSILKADLGDKGVYYRVRGAGLPSEERARQVCAELAKEKVGCLFVGK